jgi:hypothetical protein
VKKEAARFGETSVKFYEAIQLHIPKHGILQSTKVSTSNLAQINFTDLFSRLQHIEVRMEIKHGSWTLYKTQRRRGKRNEEISRLHKS